MLDKPFFFFENGRCLHRDNAFQYFCIFSNTVSTKLRTPRSWSRPLPCWLLRHFTWTYVMVPTLSSLAEVFINRDENDLHWNATSDVINDDQVGIMTTFSFQKQKLHCSVRNLSTIQLNRKSRQNFIYPNSIFSVRGLFWYHWNENVVILTLFSSLAALKVVKLTTSRATSDVNFAKMKTFSFQCFTRRE